MHGDARGQMVPFFFTTWEHYYTNEMILPIINGPSEGVSFVDPSDFIFHDDFGYWRITGMSVGVTKLTNLSKSCTLYEVPRNV